MKDFGHSYEIVKYFDGIPMKTLFVGINDFSYHWHKEVEIIFVLDGSIELVLEDKQCTLEKGDLFLINSYKVHAFGNLNQHNLLMILQFDSSICRREESDDIYTFDCNSLEVSDHKKIAMANLRLCMANLGREYHLRRAGYGFYLQSYFFKIIGILIRQFNLDGENIQYIDDRTLDWVKNILKYIDKTYTTGNLSLDEVAKFANMSSSRFSHLFKERVGISLKRYITLLRVEQAKELLKTTDFTILRIANECGLNNESLLYRTFKKHVGMTPKEYRKGNIKVHKNKVEHGYQISDEIVILDAISNFIV
ncbi:AraC family transcriptional regulator [Vallitalea okinawensis]|uniref:AraC family transcriptional regulator n=1 Tax=Vallitalea okinawensis TaxID=2078660 RepID=UPI000CFA9E9D|nr:helix-turn-helix domain-containing protein [Vallitalea okinawensis]